ncbi:hypothetical protein [Arcobacter sp.]|uniref:hypothetical protein n=1 Tax=Arcobacter sp. TaxID=1872629 RepID=UPI003D096DEA
MEIYKQYQKAYCTQKDETFIYFFIDYDFFMMNEKDDYKSIKIEARVTYPVFYKEKQGIQEIWRSNTWIVSANSYSKSCSLHDSIMIVSECRSFGIGSFMLFKLMSMLKEHVPEYSLSAKLSPVDEYEENYKRRDTLYTNMGFTIENKEIFIDKIEHLNFERKFDHIKEIDLSKEFSNLYKEKHILNDRVKDLQNSKNNLNNAWNKLFDENIKLHTIINKHYITIGFLLFCVCVYLYIK